MRGGVGVLCIAWEAYEVMMDVDKGWYSDMETSVSVYCIFVLS